ncbi:hypothetical protein B0J11DRAFT_519984 [Dendryphion nanum]|uniref:Transmembrane protein n=1 Tax=Dendryphion nanum TaxID=256645 RepID=A0A9P9EFD9_9PLEO|nr:hypothetical protein B0J11DRAFT_519984 [Dendryphion nanum]
MQSLHTRTPTFVKESVAAYHIRRTKGKGRNARGCELELVRKSRTRQNLKSILQYVFCCLILIFMIRYVWWPPLKSYVSGKVPCSCYPHLLYGHLCALAFPSNFRLLLLFDSQSVCEVSCR